MKRCMSVLAGLMIFAAGAASAGDWAQFRGPGRDGLSDEKGLMKSWPEGGPALAWKSEGLGRGYATVSFAGGKLFTMGTRADAEVILAYDAASRKELWAAKVGGIYKNNQGDGPRCTPTVDGPLVYGLGGEGNLVCVEAATGKEVWRKSLSADLGGRMMSGWGWSESPLIDGNHVICTPGGRESGVVALDKKTGAVVWKSALPDLGPAGKDGAGYASLVISEAAGVRQYVTLMGRGLVGVAAKDGKFLWSYNRAASGVANCSSPVASGDFVFGSSAYGTGAGLVKLSPGSVKADEVYFLDAKTFQNHHGGMVLVGDHLYGGHGQNAGTPVCIEYKTGKIAWRADKAPGGGSAAVLFADGHLYFRYEKGEMVLIEAKPDAFNVKGKFQIGSANGKHWPHPVILDGRLYLRDQDALLCYDIKAK